MTSEFERIRHLRSLFGKAPPGITLGIGDDAALIEPPAVGRIVWTVDACVENVHFRRSMLSWKEVGFRSFMAAASDLAAMSARPLGALSCLSFPRDTPDDDLFALAQGQHQAAQQLSTAIIGGNLSASDTVVVSTSLLGHATDSPRRDGARPGDCVALCGSVGLAAAGLRLLMRDPTHSPTTEAEREALCAWRCPRARIEEGAHAHHASSLIDVSDGLVQDAAHIASASLVRIDIDTTNMISPSLVAVAHHLGMDARSLALSGGEDYALLGTFSNRDVPPGFVVIGSCSVGSGVWVNGTLEVPNGHDHFRQRVATSSTEEDG